MTLRELITKYRFEEIIPHLKSHEREGKAAEELYLYMQAWYELQYLSTLSKEEMAKLYKRDIADIITPQKPIQVTWNSDGNEEPYVSAFECEINYWISLIGCDVLIESDKRIIKTRMINGRTDVLFQDLVEDFVSPRCSRIKRKRYARISARIEALERMDELLGKIEHFVLGSTSSVKELEFLYGCQSYWYNFETRAYNKAKRLDYAFRQ